MPRQYNNDDFSVPKWAADAFANGAREDDHLGLAKRYLDAALDLADPVSALLDSVDRHVHEELHRLALEKERDLGDWEDPVPFPDPHDRKPAPNRYARKRKRKKQQEMLDEQRYIPGKGMLPWREITIQDIDAAIEHCRRSIEGINKSIRFLESARALLVKYNVDKLGDVPGFKISDITE